MPAPSFREWLRNRAREAPAAGILPVLITRSGKGILRDDLARALRLPPRTLDDVLRALTAAGQVRMLKVGGVRHLRRGRESNHPFLTFFAAICKYFASLSIPMTREAPLFSPATCSRTDERVEKNAAERRMYPVHEAATA
jgi:hypothetical protein